ncbi:Hypothetical protein CINCED_3A010345 [Cinara cedri]|uniref:Mos1 transposase HTH domain-containing protein n=1 Tax=Cinara cedri TaxID=506608 RepID=A0A5E4MUS2_9HEMI|nr:Hypothetical protein CINCED_3A010345 [Cinara cedri]
MDKRMENSATRELRSVIRFLNAKNVKPVDTRRQICEVYGENAMSDSMVRRWVRLFNEGRTNVRDEERTPGDRLWPAHGKCDETTSCRFCTGTI